MDSNMKERNVKEAWSAYEEDGKKLMAEAIKKRDVVLKKYESISHPAGLDTDPSSKELGKITNWFGKEIVKLREKYGIK